MTLQQRLHRFFNSITPTSDSRFYAPTRIQIIAWGVVLAVSLLLSVAGYDSFQLGTYQDDSSYAVLAQSLVRSDQYALVNTPNEPIATRYPFGYPLLLAPFVILFPDKPDTMKILSLIATLMNCTLLFWGWRWFSRGTSYWWGIAIVALYALSPLTVGQTRMVMSEPVFTTFCLSVLLLAERRATSELNSRLVFITLMSIGLFFAIFTRTIGLVLMITVFGYLLATKRTKIWKEILLIVIVMICLVILVITLTPVKVSDLFPSEYMNQFTSPSSWRQTNIETSLASRFLGSVIEYFREHIRQTVLPLGGGQSEQAFAQRLGIPALPILLGFLISGIVILGLVSWFVKEGISVFPIFAVLYFGFVVMWPWRGSRFLYPIQPQLFLGFLLGTSTILLGASRLLNRNALFLSSTKTAIAVVVFALIAVSVYKSLYIDNSRIHVGDLQARSSWLESNAPPSAIVMTEEPQTDFLYSHKKTVSYGAFSSMSELEHYLNRNNVDFILIAPQLKWQTSYVPAYSDRTIRLLSLLENYPNRVELVYASERDWVKVFRVER